MAGGFPGAVLALLYFLLFQCTGFLLAEGFLSRERHFARLLLGSGGGNVLLMWLPALWAFAFGFTAPAHIAAGITAAALGVLVVVLRRRVMRPPRPREMLRFLEREPGVFLPLALWLLFCFLALHGYRSAYGELWSSQCTYGDMSMHLGFITSIARQGNFPPTYSILPPERLAYPFLSDSISASLYLLGAPLRFAYLLPMFFAGAHVFFGGWLLLRTWLRDSSKALVGTVLFFLNGGFGFAYFLGGLNNDLGNLTRIFTEFYETPTNLVAENVRWVNVIVDILVPQRASLFGWSVLFPALYLVYRAAFEGRRELFVPAGLFAGSMVMIHTHSFLALGIVSGVWLFAALGRAALRRERKRLFVWVRHVAATLFVFPFFTQFIVPNVIPRDSNWFLLLAIGAVVAFCALLVVMLVRALRHGAHRTVRSWGVYLVTAMVPALPQLFFWTFSQVGETGFVRGWYNWGNLQDEYFWFYLVNLGVFLLFAIPGFLAAKNRSVYISLPAAAIWFLSEFVVFQPNTYDNNKLLYIAYLLFIVPTADYMVELFRKLRGFRLRGALAGICILFCTLSALLTVGRECVSGYCLFGRGQLAAAAYVEENTAPDDTVLTDMRHNNEVAALAGRNIVCGSPSYVFYHGLSYESREKDLEKMFSDPAANLSLFEKYSVDYVLVSDYERGSYDADEETFAALWPEVYNEDGIQIFRVKPYEE